MTRLNIISKIAALAVLSTLAQSAVAQVTTFTWNPALTGAQSWQTNGNWDMASFPNGALHTANVSVALGSSLTLDVGATNVTVAGLTLGGASAAVTTNVASTGGSLVIQNDDASATPFNAGNGLIVSQGVAGSTNLISAPILANAERVEFGAASTRSITVSGAVSFNGASSLRSFLPTGTKVTVSGPISLVDTVTLMNANLALNDAQMNQGTLEISGTISGGGGLLIGSTSNSASLPLSTVVLSGNNDFTGRVTNNRANIVLASDMALGAGDLKQGNPSNQFGYNLLSDNDARTISILMQLAQWQTVKGEHSLTWAGTVAQTNARGWVNLLPEGKTLNLTGAHYAVSGTDLERILTFDGTGKTVVTGGLNDHSTSVGVGNYRKQGTGALVVSGGNSTYTGQTLVDGGNLHFATNADYGLTSAIISTGGAVGIDTGVAANDAFLGLIGASGNGGLMLAASESATNLDFTAFPLNTVPNMSVAAPETGMSYTGTITPANSTYRLGGGSGTLTFPIANQLTGANNVVATNGGVVSLTNTNNYTGTTTAIAKYHTTNQARALADLNSAASDLLYLGTTLSVTSLANGGAASSIGSSGNAASNLVLQGSTLKYTGAGASTDRLFTIGTGGATIDASGSGAVNFTNGGALAIDPAEDRIGDLDALAFTGSRTVLFGLPNTDDLIVGMPVTDGVGGIIPAGTTITRIRNATEVQLSQAIPENSQNLDATITFGPFPRTFTLTGTNVGANTLNPDIGDSTTGALALEKTGAGKWILGGTNTYTGATNVRAGTLLVNGSIGTGLTTVFSGATLGGTGTIGGAVVVDLGGTLAPGASVGTLSVGNNVTINGTMAVEVSGATIDKVAITGGLTLGASSVLDIQGNLATAVTHVIATTTGSITGLFGNATDATSNGYSVVYGAAQVSLVELSGDANHDGKVDIFDVNVVSASWNPLGPVGAFSPGNVNHDTKVDIFDVNVISANWFQMTSNGGGGGGAQAVPEPTALALAVVAIAGMLGAGCRRQRTRWWAK